MGQAGEPVPVQLVAAVFSRYPDLLDRAAERLEADYGRIVARSDHWPFDQTAYYEATMGAGLVKQLLAFEPLIGPADIVEIKLATNRIEEDLARAGAGAEPRPVNVDPGYLAAGKFVLATTKDYSHRVYLAKGIYAEVTLQYTKGRFEPWPWTYPDYRTPACHAFLEGVRRRYLERLKATGS